jgi:uncharacterized YccA/Bax inhibitor family protein
MRSSNPALTSNTFSGFGSVSNTETMTIQGTVNKTASLLLLVLLSSAWTWNMFFNARGQLAGIQTWMTIGLVGGFVFSLLTIFKKNWAPITAPAYACMEGLFLGAASALFESAYPGIVIQAVGLTTATLVAMLFAYRTGWIRMTDKFKLGLVASTGGIALVYFVSMILGFFGISVPFIHGSGLFSIVFSLFVVGVAALNLVMDFDFIEQASRRRVPKYMEWYGAFALMVTLVWLYIEMLRLLSKLNQRK